MNVYCELKTWLIKMVISQSDCLNSLNLTVQIKCGSHLYGRVLRYELSYPHELLALH